MSKVVSMRHHEGRLAEASRWVARMDKGLSSTDEAALQDWMAKDPRNVHELLTVTRDWDEMDELSRLAELFPEEDGRPTAAPQRNRIWVAAAVVILSIASGVWWLSGFGSADSAPTSASIADTFETAIGEQSTITLTDGTVVVLNTNSLLRVAYTDKARVLLLERGELHVEVADDGARPLSVIARDRIVQAVGTAFTVEITERDRVEVIVTNGKVLVGVRPAQPRTSESARGEQQRPLAIPPVLAETDANTVDAGQVVLLGTPQPVVASVTDEEIEVRLSWREGRLVFRGESLEEALAEIERYTTVQFVFLDPDLKTRSVTGRFRAGDVEGLLIALKTNFNISYERGADGQVLLRSL